MTLEDKYFPFHKELLEIVRGFGYQFNMPGNYITLVTCRKNEVSKDVDRFLYRIFSPFYDRFKRKNNLFLLKKFRNHFSPLRRPFLREMFADFFFLSSLGYLAIQFVTKFHSVIAFVIAVVLMVPFMKAFVISFLNIFKSEPEVLQDYYGFRKHKEVWRTDKYTFVKKMENSKLISLVSSTLILSISLSAYVVNYPILNFTNGYIDIMTFLLAVIYGIGQFLTSVLIRKSLAKAFSSLIMAIFFTVILYLNRESLNGGDQTIHMAISCFLDLFLILVVFIFLRDLIKIRNLHHWVGMIPH